MLAEDIEKKVLNLSAVERFQLVEILLDSLDKTDPEIEKIWVKESENRYRAYKEGRVNAIPLEQVRAKIEREDPFNPARRTGTA